MTTMMSVFSEMTISRPKWPVVLNGQSWWTDPDLEVCLEAMAVIGLTCPDSF